MHNMYLKVNYLVSDAMICLSDAFKIVHFYVYNLKSKVLAAFKRPWTLAFAKISSGGRVFCRGARSLSTVASICKVSASAGSMCLH